MTNESNDAKIKPRNINSRPSSQPFKLVLALLSIAVVIGVSAMAWVVGVLTPLLVFLYE